MLLGVLLFVAGIFLMILAHESGHYLTARRFGIKVDEFFLGFGPRLWSVRRGETEYGVKALPLGGYVRIAGMSPTDEPPPEDRDRVFTAKPRWQRAIVLIAGSFMHFVLAFLLLVSLFWFVGIPVFGNAQVVSVTPRLNGQPSPAAVAGLEAGDVFVQVDGQPVDDYQAFLDYIDSHAGQDVEMVVERDGERIAVRVTPVLVTAGGESRGRIGMVVSQAVVGRDRSGPLEGIEDAGRTVGRMVTGSFRAMGQVFGPRGIGRIAELLTGERDRTVNDPVGVVGAARFSGQAAEAGQLDQFLALFAFFNVFVGILNILPLPPLDGGHLAVLGYEAVTGRRVDPRKLLPITAVVAGFLILFTFSLLYLDVTNPIPNPFQ